MTPEEAQATIQERLALWGATMRDQVAVPELIVALRWPVEAGNLVLLTPEGMPDLTIADLLEGAAAMIRRGMLELHPFPHGRPQ